MLRWLRNRIKKKRYYELTDWLMFAREVKASGRYKESDYLKKARAKAMQGGGKVLRMRLEKMRDSA